VYRRSKRRVQMQKPLSPLLDKNLRAKFIKPPSFTTKTCISLKGLEVDLDAFVSELFK